MKLCVVILAGAGDRPLAKLGDSTPLEAAHMPRLAALVNEGRAGGVRTTPDGQVVGPASAAASLLGVEPGTYPAEGALLAAAIGVELAPLEIAFRCDLVNLYAQTVVDPTAGRLGSPEAEVLVQMLQEELGSDQIRFLPGDGWRSLIVLGGGLCDEVRSVSPASFMGEPIDANRPRGRGAHILSELMGKAAAMLEEHEINTVRVDLGENPANGIWIWGGGRSSTLLPPIGGGGVAIGRHPSFRGLARCGGLETIELPRAATPADELDATAGAALSALADHEFTAVHAGGALNLSRLGETEAKVSWLEEADRLLIGPLADRMVATGEGRLMIAVGHIASTELRRDVPGIVPFVIAGSGTSRYGEARFTESGAAESDLIVERGHELLEFAARA